MIDITRRLGHHPRRKREHEKGLDVGMPTPEKTGQQQARDGNGRFRPGRSGNPTGRPHGSRHRATLAAERLLDGEAEALTRKAIELALDGDLTALRLCLDRVIPARKSRPVDVALPKVAEAGDLPIMTSRLLEAISTGELSPGEALEIGKLADTHRAAIELADIEQRLAALEAAQGRQRP